MDGRHDERDGERFEGERLDDLADAPHAGPPADEAERDVGAEPRRRRQVGVPGPAQDRRGVGRSPTEAATVRDLLVDVHGGTAAGEAQRSSDEVGAVRRDPRGVRAADGEAVARFVDIHRVGEVERDHLGVDEVVAVVRGHR